MPITDTVTWVRGAHTVKAGVAYTRTINNQIGVVTSFYTGAVVFNPAGNPNSTGNAIADMLLGNFRTYSEVAAPPQTPWRSTQVDAFVSDSWKLQRRLSIEYGARLRVPRRALYAERQHGHLRSVALRPGARRDGQPQRHARRQTGDVLNGMVKAGVDGAPRGHYESPFRVAPRLSFAYAPFNNNRTAAARRLRRLLQRLARRHHAAHRREPALQPTGAVREPEPVGLEPPRARALRRVADGRPAPGAELHDEF